MRDLINKYSYSQNWNIGFCEQSYENLIKTKRLGKIKWMRHSFNDRWFADPFILNVTKSDIIVFVEECPIVNSKGILCELVIDRKTYRLKQRYVLLELDTHLSYPAIIKENGKIYVYPENGKSGQLNIYEYDALQHKLIDRKCILNEAVADASIAKVCGDYYLICTRYPDTQSAAYLYKAYNLFGPYNEYGPNPVSLGENVSRPGGNWFLDASYRPAQICSPRYGSGLAIQRTHLALDKFEEQHDFDMFPTSWRYNIGLHTINNFDGLMVVDGYGYKYPLIGRFITMLRGLKRLMING